MKWFYRSLIELTNSFFLSKLLEKFTTSSLSRLFIPNYIKAYKINMEEPDKYLFEYKSLHEFFIRKLKKGSRMICDEENCVISPVDGVIQMVGKISSDLEFIVKNKPYSISEMIGENYDLDKFQGGSIVIIYLSPSHYHRIHSPLNGVITEQWSLGGKSYPVNNWGLQYGHAPLSKNFRKLSEIKFNDNNHMVLVKVGALFINSIQITFEGDRVKRGEELAYFSFGSTVILLFERGSFTPIIGEGKEVKMGEMIGHIN